MADCTESIYNLMPQPKALPSKATRRENTKGLFSLTKTATFFFRYNSTFRQMVQEEYKARKDPSKTMGPAKVSLTSTNDFLKKRSGEQKFEKSPPRVAGTTTTLGGSKKPPVPRRHEHPVMGVKSNKNFVKTNAIENMLARK